MTKKKINISLIIIMILISMTSIKVYAAANIGWASVSLGASSSADNNEPSHGDKIYYSSDGMYQYKCTYDYEISPNTSITINSYDMLGITQMNNTVKMSNTFLSGTWIGLRIQETRFSQWSLYQDSFVYYELKKEYTCNYNYTEEKYTPKSCNDTVTENFSAYASVENGCPPTYTRIGGCGCGQGYCCHVCEKCASWTPSSTTYIDHPESKTYKVSYGEETTCPTTISKDGNIYNLVGAPTKSDTLVEEEIIATPDISNGCETLAKNSTREAAEAYVQYPSSELKYIDTNEYPDDEADLSAKLTSLPHTRNITSGGSEDGFSGWYKGIFNYKPNYVCLDVKTGKVRYINKNCTGVNCKCKDEEMDVTSGVGDDNQSYWRYFIPLNTKTNSKFYIKLEKSGDSADLTKEECYSVIENYEDYENYIRQKNGNDFEGDVFIKNGKINTGRKSKDLNAIKSQGGCSFATSVNINVEQKFYNEVEEKDGIVFNGFNFYYKPIDITNPFPNGVASNSLWKDVWNSTTNKVTTSKNTTVNLSDSFKKMTYEATNLRLNEIRNYGNEANKLYYTSWSDMDVDGSSSFVKDYVTRITDKSSYYRLGCGPANASWGGCT